MIGNKYYLNSIVIRGLIVLIGILAMTACSQKAGEKDKPNILWIYLEDTSPLLSCYGDTLIQTPNIDHLAENGIIFTNAFMPAPVCSPCRSSIITGTMSTSLGLHNHHSARTEESAIYLPDHVKTIPELFKNEGYFTFNNGKDDYNFTYDRKDLYDQNYFVHPLYGKSGERLDISELKDHQPFFGQIQLYGGKEIFSASFKERVISPVDRSRIELPPYLPYHPAIIEEYANHLDAIQITDGKVGEIIEILSESGLLESTIIFFFSDHGMRLTRHKQFLYDGGIHVPLIIADFSKTARIGSEITNDDLISGIDLGTSSLALANIPIPEYMEGLNIFGDSNSREYIISSRDRCDFTIDRIRSVRSGEFKYIRNFMTDRPYMQPTYMDADSVEFVLVMKQLYAENKLDSIQSRFLSDERPYEELYSLMEDPYEVNNLAGTPEYSEVLSKYSAILDHWIAETDDQGQYPESEEGLKLMLGIWGKHAINPEYEPLRKQYKDLEGSQLYLKNQSWAKVETALDILDKTIKSIDTIETIYYKQDMARTNTRQINDTIFRFREMHFKRLIQDSIVGVKGHWYFYSNDRSKVNYEDIYDGDRLIRKNNLDSTALLYDLIKFPEFAQQHFWSHNTLFGMQFLLRFVLDNINFYTIKRLNDTTFMNKHCYQISIQLDDKMTMPGFASKLENSEGSISKTLFFIDSQNYYPIRMKEEQYSKKSPEQKSFIDQVYYDIKFNIEIDEKNQFNTSGETISGYEIIEKKP